jgi:hydroxypyruvate isomerase
MKPNSMDRRKFIHNTIATAAATVSINLFANNANAMPAEKPFNAKFAPHDGMFKNSGGATFPDQIKYMHDMGFRAVEDNGMLARPKEEQEKIGSLLTQLGMTMGVFVLDAGDNWKVSYTTGNKDLTSKFVDTCKQAVEVAKRVNAKWMTVVPGYYERKLPIGIQTANVVEVLRRGAEVLEPHGLVMVLEPLSDNPDLFMRTAPQTYELCKAVQSPSCKILYDIYHMQRNEGNLINTIDWCWDEIAYYQIGDNPGRKEPGTGEINYKNIFKHVHDKGYRGVWGMEHGNFKEGKEGESALIKAYRDCDVASV